MVRQPTLRLLILALPLVAAAAAWLAVPAARETAQLPFFLIGLAGAAAAWFSSSPLLQRLGTLREAARSASEGDLERPFPADEQDLVGETGAQLEKMRRAVRDRVHDLQVHGDEQARLIDQSQRAVQELRSSVSHQLPAIEETVASVHEMTTSMKQIAQSVETLASAAEESSSSILEMAAANDEVSANMVNLAGSVQESAASIEEMTFSIKEVAKNVEALSSTAEETSSSMNEMDISIRQVENNANETARLSEEVSRAAQMGADAITHTIEGINKIKGYSEGRSEERRVGKGCRPG